ncbi:hypothetical protein RUM43_012708 [Polyplax serrata]|uniref:Uncharacterized protein n=1 Tax=Polyplax serrata TaxID=468196 RepID=A0AAN8Q326_POLSC
MATTGSVQIGIKLESIYMIKEQPLLSLTEGIIMTEKSCYFLYDNTTTIGKNKHYRRCTVRHILIIERTSYKAFNGEGASYNSS